MLRYFLHLRRDGSLIEDCEGGEFACLDDARASAKRSLHEMLAADVRTGILDFAPQIVIADQEGVVKGIVHVGEGLTLRGLDPDPWNTALPAPLVPSTS